MRSVAVVVGLVCLSCSPALAKRRPKAPNVQAQFNAVLDGRAAGLQACALEHGINKGARSVVLAAKLMINNFGQVMHCAVEGTADDKASPQLSRCAEGVLAAAPFPKTHEALISIERTWKFSTN